MNVAFSESPDLFDRVQAFVNSGESGTTTQIQLTEFEQLLRQSEEAQDLYIELIEMSVYLPRALVGTAAARDDGDQNVEIHDGVIVHAATSGYDLFSCSSIADQPSTSSSPRLPFLSTTLHGAIGYFSEGLPLAYLLATVIFGVGLLIGSRIYVSGPEQVAQQSVPLHSPLSPLPSSSPFVGRITGMVDCRWADDSTAAINGAHVPLGRKYALTAGLLEITYDTGAKVILQGPVAYEVESKDGGYLAFGKLAARVEKNEERRTKNEEVSASHSSFLIPHSYFAVRTPTATVTDLGTEFGVEVAKDGMNHVEVFQGEVELAQHGTGLQNAPAEKIRLIAGQTARLGGAGAIERSAASNATYAFVRALPKPKAPALPDLAGVRLWVRADAGVFKDTEGKTPADVGDSVAVWADQSENGRNAVQTNRDSRPVLAIGPGGKPVVRFDGADDVLSFDELRLPDDCTIIAVAGNHGDNRFFVLLGQHGGDAIAPDWSDRSRLVYDGATDNSALSEGADFRDDAYRIFSVRKFAEGGSNAIAWHTNGLRDSLSNTNMTNSHTLNFNEIGARTFENNPVSAPGQFGRQDIVELMVFDRDLSSAERRSVEAYLKHKYRALINSGL